MTVPAMGEDSKMKSASGNTQLRDLRSTGESGPWEFGAGAVGGQTTDTLDCCVFRDEKKRSGKSLARWTTIEKDVPPFQGRTSFFMVEVCECRNRSASTTDSLEHRSAIGPPRARYGERSCCPAVRRLSRRHRRGESRSPYSRGLLSRHCRPL